MAGTDNSMLVICGSEGAETIWIDSAGNPVEPDQTCIDCPDCTESVADTTLLAPSIATSQTPQELVLLRLPAGLPSAIQPHLRPATRAPPSLASLWLKTEQRSTVFPTDCPRHV